MASPRYALPMFKYDLFSNFREGVVVDIVEMTGM
jgi:hypothetical protein